MLAPTVRFPHNSCKITQWIIFVFLGPKSWERNGHWYFLSSNITIYADVKSDWLDARNLCRKHCMDAISIETVEENDMVLQILEKGISWFPLVYEYKTKYRKTSNRETPLHLDEWTSVQLQGLRSWRLAACFDQRLVLVRLWRQAGQDERDPSWLGLPAMERYWPL